MKDPRSKDYAIQTVHALKRWLESKKIDETRISAELEEINVYKHWEVLGYTSLEEMLKAELGQLSDDAQAALDRALGTHGGDRKSETFKENQGCVTTLKRGTSEHWKARLERDGRDELLVRVNSGELSAHAAAIEAGWRKRMIQCEPTVDGFTRAITKHLSEAQREELKERI